MRRVLAGVVALAAATARGGPSPLPPPPDYAQVGRLSVAEARQVLASVQAAGLSRPAYFEFELRSLPRRGAEQDHPGRLWVSRDDAGPVWRLELEQGRRRFLVQNGPAAAVWEADAGGARRVPLGEPLLPGLNLTPFDLLMPYLYWQDVRPIGIMRVLGRPADVIELRPPAGFEAQVPGVAAVRAYLDGEFHAPVEAECLDAQGRVVKTLALVDLKRLGGQTLPKDIDVRDEATRDKVRFSLTAAALGVEPSPALFEPDALGQSLASPAASQIARF